MFGDPLNVQSSSTQSTTIALAVVDTDNGRVVRQLNQGSGTFVKNAIAHTVTKDNGPVVLTDKTLVRFDLTKANPLDGKPVTASAYLVLAAPRAVTTNADVITQAFRLINWLLGTSGSSTITEATAGTGVTLKANLDRLLNGES